MLLLALATALAACTSSPPGATPSPSGPARTTSPTTPADSPTPPPTGATATPSPSPSTGPVESGVDGGPTAADLVLRMYQGGGFVPLEFVATEAPQFSLYSDGTVIYGGRVPPNPGPGGPAPTPLRVATMDADQVDALLRFALGRGRLMDARASYEEPTIADAPTTIFTVNTPEVKKTVSIYALGETDPKGADAADRRGFRELAEILRDFTAQVEQGNATDAGAYEPDRYRVVLTEVGEQGGGGASALSWPFEGRTPRDFQPDGERGLNVAYLSGAELEGVTETPTAGTAGIIVSGPDGKVYMVALRPALPDEGTR